MNCSGSSRSRSVSMLSQRSSRPLSLRSMPSVARTKLPAPSAPTRYLAVTVRPLVSVGPLPGAALGPRADGHLHTVLVLMDVDHGPALVHLDVARRPHVLVQGILDVGLEHREQARIFALRPEAHSRI
jgi:hypothetical protein